MKKYRKIPVMLTALTLTVCSVSGSFSAVAEEAETEVKVSFNITEDMTPDSDTDASLFEDTVSSLGYYNIPIGSFEKEDCLFSGWTINNIDGYLSGETYIFPEGTTEVVFEPVWRDITDTNTYNVTYNLEFNGETIEYPEWLKDKKAYAGQIITPDFTEIQLDNAFTHGLTIMDGHKIEFGRHFIMPAEDVVVTPIWLKKITFTFLAGDVDRLNGSVIQTFPKNEGSTTDLPKSDRFSRDGFNLVGWLSDYDGQVYKPLEVITCPDVDVTFTAVWEPKIYNVVFKQGNGGSNLKVEGATDTQIICPEPDITVDGKYFAGWQDEKGDIYLAGSEYTILGAKPGTGIMLTAVWQDGEAPETTTGNGGNTEVTLIGDANEDEIVDIADATSIIQHIGNKDKYALSEQGEANADCYNTGDGITGSDAMAIQKLEAKLITSLPEMPEK